MSTTSTKTEFSDAFQCKELCTFLTQYNLKFPSDLPKPSSVQIKFVYASTATVSQIYLHDVDLTQPGPYTLPQITTGTNTEFTVSFFITITFPSSMYTPPYAVETTYLSVLDFIRKIPSVTDQIEHRFNINSLWGVDLSTNPDAEVGDDVDPMEFFGAVFPVASSTKETLRTIVSFTNYYSNPITSINLVLSGISTWTFSSDDVTELNACTINGINVPVNYLNNADAKISNNKIITLTVPDSLKPSVTIDRLITIACGEGLYNLGIVYDKALAEVLTTFNIAPPGEPAQTAGIPSETLTVIPVYGASTATDGSYPQTQHVFNILPSFVAETEANLGKNRLNLTPLFTYVDRRLKENGPAAVSAMLAVDFKRFVDYSRPFDISIVVSGLIPDHDKITEKVIPRILLSIEPDYSVELTPNGSKKPTTPEGLVSMSYILPLSTDTWSTPRLRVNEGFLATYTKGNPTQFTALDGSLPKRYINIIIPQDSLNISEYPIGITVNINYADGPDDSSRIISLTSLSLLENRDAQIDPRDFSWKAKNIQADKIDFRVAPVNDKYIMNFPDFVSISYPMLRYRFTYPSRTQLQCIAQYEICRRTNRSKRCSLVTDNGLRLHAVHMSQNRVDVSIESFSPSWEHTWRQIECKGAWIIEQKPAVMDFRGRNELTLSTQSGPVVKNSWGPLQEGSVSSVVSHKYVKSGSTTGFTEVYSVKNRISRGLLIFFIMLPFILFTIFLVGCFIFSRCKRNK
jgi:hypothetical protein